MLDIRYQNDIMQIKHLHIFLNCVKMFLNSLFLLPLQ